MRHIYLRKSIGCNLRRKETSLDLIARSISGPNGNRSVSFDFGDRKEYKNISLQAGEKMDLGFDINIKLRDVKTKAGRLAPIILFTRGYEVSVCRYASKSEI